MTTEHEVNGVVNPNILWLSSVKGGTQSPAWTRNEHSSVHHRRAENLPFLLPVDAAAHRNWLYITE